MWLFGLSKPLYAFDAITYYGGWTLAKSFPVSSILELDLSSASLPYPLWGAVSGSQISFKTFEEWGSKLDTDLGIPIYIKEPEGQVKLLGIVSGQPLSRVPRSYIYVSLVYPICAELSYQQNKCNIF